MNRTCIFQRIRLSPRWNINILLRQIYASHFSTPLHLFFIRIIWLLIPSHLVHLIRFIAMFSPPPPHRDAQRTCNSVRNASLHSRSVLHLPRCVRLAPQHHTVVRRAKNKMVGIGPLAMHRRKVKRWGARRTELLRTTRGADIASSPIFRNASFPLHTAEGYWTSSPHHFIPSVNCAKQVHLMFVPDGIEARDAPVYASLCIFSALPLVVGRRCKKEDSIKKKNSTAPPKGTPLGRSVME